MQHFDIHCRGALIIYQRSDIHSRGALIIYQRSDIHSRGALPFLETHNRGLKLRKNHPEFP
jgi:hypothetical protein